MADSWFLISPNDIYYLTGFYSSHRDIFAVCLECDVIPHFDSVSRNKDSRIILFTSPLVAKQLRDSIKDIEFSIFTDIDSFIKAIKDDLKKKDISSLKINEHDTKVSEKIFFEEKLELELLPTSAYLLKQRAIKNKSEIEYLNEAAKQTILILEVLEEWILTKDYKVTEMEIYEFLFEQSFNKSLFEFSFDPVIAFDENAALPHYDFKQSLNKEHPKENILVDFGVKYNSYCGDITRCFIKPEASELQKKYKTLEKIKQDCIEMIKPGINMKDINEHAKRRIKEEFDMELIHSIGHGVGIEVHELPNSGKFSELKPGNVITIEPGIYLDGKFGLRTEDMVLVTDNGYKLLGGK